MTRKNTLFVAAALIVGSAPAMLSCSDQHDEITVEAGPADSFGLVGEELDKARYGCVYEDDEFADEDAATKVETRATDEYMAFLKRQNGPTLKFAQYSKPFVYPARNLVGVAKVTTCGIYDEFRVFFDAEDHKPASDIKPHDGRLSWKRDGNGNIEMTFCAVPAHLFDNSEHNYGLLMLAEFPVTNAQSHEPDKYHPRSYASVITCFLDAEDGRSCSTDFLNVEDKYLLPNTIDGNGNLTLKILCMRRLGKSYGPMPHLGFPYGVFGRFGSETYDVYFDCEDDHCSSDAHSTEIYIENGNLITFEDGNLADYEAEFVWENGNVSYQVSVVNP